MKMYHASDTMFVCAEQQASDSTLYCLTKDLTLTRRSLPGKITGITQTEGNILCLTEVRDRENDKQEVVLHTLNSELKEISSKTLFERKMWYDGLASTLNDHHAYTLRFSTASTSFVGENQPSFDILVDMIFSKIDLSTGEKVEWSIEEMPDVVNGFASGVEKMFFSGDRLMLECNVYDPDSEFEVDDPDFAIPSPSDPDFVEFHTYNENVCIDFEGKKIEHFSGWLHHDFSIFPDFSCQLSKAKPHKVLCVACGENRLYEATDNGFYCVDLQSPIKISWNWLGYQERDETLDVVYQHFHLWNDRLVFEKRTENEITGFLVCPATFSRPNDRDMTLVALNG